MTRGEREGREGREEREQEEGREEGRTSKKVRGRKGE